MPACALNTVLGFYVVAVIVVCAVIFIKTVKSTCPSSLQKTKYLTLSSDFMNVFIDIDVLCVTVVKDHWAVTHTTTQICAFKGSTVDISCTYRYPPTVWRVTDKFWFTKENDGVHVDLRTDFQYKGRVEYICDDNRNICTLRITDLRESDSAEYKFRFITNQGAGKYSSSPGVTLSVTGNIFTEHLSF